MLVLDGTCPVTINFCGTGVTNFIGTGAPLTFNPSGPPKDLLIQSAATGNFTFNDHLNGNMTIDAPLSTWNLTSTSTIQGAMIVNTYNTSSDIHLHYDRSLGAGLSTASTTQMTSYSRSKF